jgi:hypothetical protein
VDHSAVGQGVASASEARLAYVVALAKGLGIDPDVDDPVSADVLSAALAGDEAGAVSALRKQYPGLSLVQATRVVRALPPAS